MSELIFLFGEICSLRNLMSFDDSSYFKECVVRSLTEKKEQRLRMFRNRVLRKIFGYLENEIIEKHNVDLHAVWHVSRRKCV